MQYSTGDVPGMLPKPEEMLRVMYKKMEDCTLKGTKPSSSKVSEKMIYLNCSESS
jgi:hypothetical protein